MRRMLLRAVLAVLLCAFWMAPLSGQQPGETGSPSKEGQAEEPSQGKTDDVAAATPDSDNSCIDCHRLKTPGIVSDWEQSAHARNDVACGDCHGILHNSNDDVASAEPALPEKCAECHPAKVEEFNKGKHSLAWMSMNAMPTLHWQPMAQIEGLKGCGGCHRIGSKSETEVKILADNKSAHGVSSCDTCHTRHLFSVAEARSPQACQTCHMGMDHPQWEMFSTAKHGVRSNLKQLKILPESAAAPTCQFCHMSEGNHAVRTSWGFLAVRLPMPEDKEWAADRTTILQGLGLLDASEKPTERMEAAKAADLMRLTQEDWQKQRDAMLKICNNCHSGDFARAELEKSDRMIWETDRLMAEGLRTINALYQDGILQKPGKFPAPLPDLFTFHDAPTVIEQKLFLMFFEHRMRAFQGAFHANPDYSFWYGWSPMQRDLTEIKEKAAEMRAKRAASSQNTAKTGPKPARPPVKKPTAN